MRAAITGATGLLGGNLAIHLLQNGWEVVATKRSTSRTQHLSDFDIEWIDAPLQNVDALTRAFARADVVFHCAAAVSIREEVQPWIYAANVQGTKNVIDAVDAAGADRLVHCSSVSVVGVSTDGAPCTEESDFNMPEFGLDDAYVKTKREAQDLALAAADDGMDVVVVCPTFMVGPYDAKPSSGELLLNIVNRRVPGYSSGDSNFVDVRDVARGMRLAAERGGAGELYILGGHNMTHRAFMDLVSDVAGTKPIGRTAPRRLAALAGRVGDLVGKLTGDEPVINSSLVRWGYVTGYQFSSQKAIDELGYRISPLEPAIHAAIEWFRQHDML